MYAAIHRHAAGSAPPDDCARAGRALAARLGAVPGFVAYLLLEEPGGGYVAVSLFEDRADLEAAEQPDADWPDPVALAAGEVVVQKGL